MPQDAYLSEVTWTAATFSVAGTATCDGSLVPIDQNIDLFTLLGTAYGGDGEENFRLPRLVGNVAVGGAGGQVGPVGTLASGTDVALVGLIPSIAIQGRWP